MVGTYDPRNIAELLQRHPFHVRSSDNFLLGIYLKFLRSMTLNFDIVFLQVDSLLQLSDVELSMGRFQDAAQLVKRALYVS